MKRKNTHKGFTLIELLVVVAIIAILSATILVALNSARKKAKDAKVESEMSDLRAQMELFYNTHGTYSATQITDCNSGPFASAGGADNASVLVNGIAADLGIANFYGMQCAASSDAWAVAVWLSSDNTKGWCVDSNGASKQGYTASPTLPFSPANSISPAPDYHCL